MSDAGLAGPVGYARTDSLARAPLAHLPTENVCLKCGRRLVDMGAHGRVKIVHEHGLIRCEPPAAFDCAVCAAPALMQCSVSACPVMAHPDCLVACSCCGKRFCVEHVEPGGTRCLDCSAAGAEPTEDEEQEGMWS